MAENKDPVGQTEFESLSDEDLESVAGGLTDSSNSATACCNITSNTANACCIGSGPRLPGGSVA